MPPFHSRRFDPYGNDTNSTTNNNGLAATSAPTTRPSTGRTRTLISGTNGGVGGGGLVGGGGSRPPQSSTTFGNAGVYGSSSSRPVGTIHDRVLGVGGGGESRQRRSTSPPNNNGYGGYNDDRLGGVGHVGVGGSNGNIYNDYNASYGQPQLQSSSLPQSHIINNNNNNGIGLMNRRSGNVGAAPLSSQVHPLLASKQQNSRGGYYDGSGGYTDQYQARGRTGPYDDRDDHHDHDPTTTSASQQRPPRSRSKSRPRRPHQRRSPLQKRAAHLLHQTRRILSLLLGQIPEQDAIALQKQRRGEISPGYIHQATGETEEEILMNLLSAKSTARILRFFLLLPLLFVASQRVLPPVADKITRPKPWSWSAGVTLPGSKDIFSKRHRNLAGRNCVMNYFIEKQPPDEYDPDFIEIKPGEKDKDGRPKVRPPITIVDGTYRTKGQVHVISRFIEAIADSFRSNTKIRQHLIFTESRDGGHLAYEAMRHWPPRGKHKTMIHVLASEDLPMEDLDSRNIAKALGYGSLEDIELKFKGNDKARVYDRDGNLAGLPATEGVDDDEVDGMEDLDVPDRETLELRVRSGKNRRKVSLYDNSTSLLEEGIKPYPNLRALLPFEDEDDGEGDIVVPYLHVDGITMAHQMVVLDSARSLLEDQTIVVVGIEHSKDLDVRALISFFQRVKYKTFFLGARQIARIDNLCEEVLDDVLEHPSVSIPKTSWMRRLFIKLGLISKDELRMIADPKEKKRQIVRELKLELARANGAAGSEGGPKRRETPPFFVAMPRGRRSKEEMTIQHMYDLFGGYGGGGGQIKTANDRKAPGK